MTAHAPLATSEFPLLQLRQAAGNIDAGRRQNVRTLPLIGQCE